MNWGALASYGHVLARRTGDRQEWWIGVGRSGRSSDYPGMGTMPWFGHAGYDLKNRFEQLTSRHPAQDGFAASEWWIPRMVFHFRGNEAGVHIVEGEKEAGRALLEALVRRPAPPPPAITANWVLTTPKEVYLRQVETLLAHIRRGDIYEVNYCTQRTASLPGLNPWALFGNLVRRTDAPFAALLRHGDHFAICASPERFLRIEGDRILSQPMKGTRPRGASPGEDAALAAELASDPKERSENIMALDVARNDLSRIAAAATVTVEELCAVKTYPNVHQMVSTVSAGIRPGTTPADIMRATFPMASMTGAPKIRAMQLIDEVEHMRRGIYSGTMGYFLPDGTADLNVVIRTITWDAATGRASLITGGAITAGSDPESEFRECEHKAASVLNALGHAG